MRFLSVALLLGVVVSVIAQNESISVTSVAVWVKATDEEGKAATGLLAQDFSIHEDNQQMTISCFEGDNETPQQKRKLILAVDLYNTSNTEFFSIREEAQNFVDKLDPQTWQVMLAVIMAGPPAEIVSFTDQFDQIYNDLESMKANTLRDQEMIQRRREITDQLRSGGRGRSRAVELANFYAQDEQQISQQTLRGLAGLAKYVIDHEEHVVIVLISGGINTRPGLQYLQLLERGEARENVDVDLTAFRNISLMDKIQKHVSPLLEKNVTIYCLNTRGNFNPGLDQLREELPESMVTDRSMLSYYQEGMDEIAALTGGISFKNSNDFEKPFATILSDTIGHYIICYKPEPHEKEKYRKIEVRTSKPGIKLRHRKGYWSSGSQK